MLRAALRDPMIDRGFVNYELCDLLKRSQVTRVRKLPVVTFLPIVRRISVYTVKSMEFLAINLRF